MQKKSLFSMHMTLIWYVALVNHPVTSGEIFDHEIQSMENAWKIYMSKKFTYPKSSHVEKINVSKIKFRNIISKKWHFFKFKCVWDRQKLHALNDFLIVHDQNFRMSYISEQAMSKFRNFSKNILVNVFNIWFGQVVFIFFS